MTTRRFSAPALFLVGSIPMTCALHGAGLYVSTAGLDTNPGTAELPWRTVQKAADTAVAGDVVNLRAGTYAERVTLMRRNGTAAAPIIFRKFPGDAEAAIISQGGVTPPNDLSAVFKIENCNHIILQGLEIANYKTSGTNAQQKAQLPAGIYINGGGAGVQIRNCKVHDIWQSCATSGDFDANGFGIAVYGDAATPIDQLVIDGCEIYQLRTGASESVALNGNVINFAVTNNVVHDCNNIGIDFIGFESANGNPALDQARNGICSGNTVYRIDSKFNPAYGGNFTTGGNNNTRSAPGLYVDGAKDILIERNHVYDCNYGLSAGSEWQNKVASNITVRSNIFHHCHVGGIVIGGSESTNGGLNNSSFSNNTLYGNDTDSQGGGQFAIQNHVSGTTIRRNLMVSTAAFTQFVLKDNSTGSFASGAIDWNLYKLDAGDDFEFIWNGSASSTFAAWQGGGARDAHSALITGAVGLVGAAPTAASPAGDFALTATSPATDTGDSAALPFTPAAGEKDYFGQSRGAGGRVDIGADEFMTALQSWRDAHYSLPDGGAGAGQEDDPDRDGVVNLIEYSQGMNPMLEDLPLLPAASLAANNFRFTYRRAAGGLTYEVQTNQNLGTWLPAEPLEQTDGSGLYWRDFPMDGGKRFVRLKVTPASPW